MASKKCDICFDNKSEDEFGFLPCSHSFCSCCLDKLRQSICPMCRNPFSEYTQTSYSRSVPISSNVFLSDYYQGSTQDDLYVEDRLVTQRTLRRRQRRRRRRRGRRNPHIIEARTLEARPEEIFYLDEDLIESLDIENKEEMMEGSRDNRVKIIPRRDNWQILNSQRSNFTGR